MKTGVSTHAYTIVEVMIVLVVTGALLISTLTLISGQQRKTEFTQAVREVESQIQDIINDVATGFYPDTNNFTCNATASTGPSFTGGDKGQGTNQGCIYLGRVLHFGVGNSSNSFNIYTVAGRRQTTGAGGQAKEAETLAQTYPIVVSATTDNQTLRFGLSTTTMKYVNSGITTNIGAVAFISSLAAYNPGTSNLVSGSQKVELFPVVTTPPPSQPNQSEATIVSAVTSYLISLNPVKNPDGGVIICFKSGGTDQYGQITIGSNERQLTTKMTIGSGGCP